MSKSRKYPIYRQKSDKYFKKLSNKKIRKFLLSLEQGFKSTKLFKQIVDHWNICDWRFVPRDKEDAIKASRK